MSRPSILPIGTSLLYKKHDLLGDAIGLGEWTNGREDADYCHIALVYDGKQLVRQNPGGPAFETLDSQDWQYIDAFLLDLQGREIVTGPTETKEEVWAAAFERARLKHWTEGYAYLSFGELISEDVLSRLGDGGGTDKLRSETNAMMYRHQSICSVWAWQEVLTDAVRDAYQWPDFVMFAKLGMGQARPADAVLCPWLDRP